MGKHTATLVLGAGELGMSVLRGLAARIASSAGDTVSVLLRPDTINSQDPKKQKQIEQILLSAAQVVAGDLAAGSQADLAALFCRYDTVIGCTGFVAGRGTQRKLAEAVLQAGVHRYVPWQFGVDYDAIGRGSAQDLFDEQLDVRDLLRSQYSTEWIIISTGMFTSFLFEPSFGVVDLSRNRVHALGSLETEVTVTTAEDIGVLTAEILYTAPRIANQIVYTAGDTITYAELADTVDRTTGRKVDRVAWSVSRLKEDLARDPENSLKKYRVIFAEGKGVAWSRHSTFNMQKGLPVTGTESWALNNLKF